jgi:hypothetical protein
MAHSYDNASQAPSHCSSGFLLKSDAENKASTVPGNANTGQAMNLLIGEGDIDSRVAKSTDPTDSTKPNGRNGRFICVAAGSFATTRGQTVKKGLLAVCVPVLPRPICTMAGPPFNALRTG